MRTANLPSSGMDPSLARRLPEDNPFHDSAKVASLDPNALPHPPIPTLDNSESTLLVTVAVAAPFPWLTRVSRSPDTILTTAR